MGAIAAAGARVVVANRAVVAEVVAEAATNSLVCVAAEVSLR
jgi:hypothetical protein